MITASCHCGAVRFEIEVAPETITDCNCSICRRLGTLWAYYRPQQVKIIAAPGATLAYRCNENVLEFHSCRTCGCTTHWAWGPERKPREDSPEPQKMAVNARLMDLEVITGLRVRHLDGAHDWAERFSTFPA